MKKDHPDDYYDRLGIQSTDQWKQLITKVVLENEPPNHVEEIVNSCWKMGTLRAQLLERDFLPYEDPVYILSLFCWWPFKPPVTSEYRVTIRRKWNMISRIQNESEVEFIIDRVIPKELLIMETKLLWRELSSNDIINYFNKNQIKHR